VVLPSALENGLFGRQEGRAVYEAVDKIQPARRKRLTSSPSKPFSTQANQ
jgi:hypothetical protein